MLYNNNIKIHQEDMKMDMEPKKLYRSRNDRVIAGICGGLGKFLNLDSTVIRLILAILCIIGGSGLLIYIIAALIIPEEPYM